MFKQPIKWNPKLKLILSDVDETIADVYTPATPQMIEALTSLLTENISIFMITGASLTRVNQRIVNNIKPSLRHRILVAHCMGAEVWGYKNNGDNKTKPFISVYDKKLSSSQKRQWRNIVRQLISEFHLLIHKAIPVKDFQKKVGNEPLDIMLEDRGPQITFEFVNAFELSQNQVKELKIDVRNFHNVYDLRLNVMERAEELIVENKLPIIVKLGGMFALDFIIQGVSKLDTIHRVLKNPKILQSIGVAKDILDHPEQIEIWGDKFSELRRGYDSEMSKAVSPTVRSIDFRQEKPEEFPKSYNIVLWDGKKHLHEGLLEYLKTKYN
jgi:hydroxymethylpyrimidine pyrophosphatase-like HAD family hydrolase